MNILNRLTATALLALATSVSLAAPGAMHGGDTAGMFERPAEAIGLSDDQLMQIEAIRGASHEATTMDREELESLKEQLQAMDDNFDPALAAMTTSEMGAIMGRLIYARAQSSADIRAVLSTDQLAQLDALKQQRQGGHFARPSRRFSGPSEF
jgi:Spy/CpxP family protein refolding chaperone